MVSFLLFSYFIFHEVLTFFQLDALLPAVDAFNNVAGSNGTLVEALSSATDAARKGSDSTIGMVPQRGRGQYLGERVKNERDGGAEAIAFTFQALKEFMEKQ